MGAPIGVVEINFQLEIAPPPPPPPPDPPLKIILFVVFGFDSTIIVEIRDKTLPVVQ